MDGEMSNAVQIKVKCVKSHKKIGAMDSVLLMWTAHFFPIPHEERDDIFAQFRRKSCFIWRSIYRPRIKEQERRGQKWGENISETPPIPSCATKEHERSALRGQL